MHVCVFSGGHEAGQTWINATVYSLTHTHTPLSIFYCYAKQKKVYDCCSSDFSLTVNDICCEILLLGQGVCVCVCARLFPIFQLLTFLWNMLQMPLSRSGRCERRDRIEFKVRDCDSSISCTASCLSVIDLRVCGRIRKKKPNTFLSI